MQFLYPPIEVLQQIINIKSKYCLLHANWVSSPTQEDSEKRTGTGETPKVLLKVKSAKIYNGKQT